ncbi:MAG TPA: hypothetical protein VD993_19035 [Chitinophagaceae bacterium]|nr:hypothetical protein [Chitinophagaceae bacterium]
MKMLSRLQLKKIKALRSIAVKPGIEEATFIRVKTFYPFGGEDDKGCGNAGSGKDCSKPI